MEPSLQMVDLRRVGAGRLWVLTGGLGAAGVLLSAAKFCVRTSKGSFYSM
jgi:hypothetical protein